MARNRLYVLLMSSWQTVWCLIVFYLINKNNDHSVFCSLNLAILVYLFCLSPVSPAPLEFLHIYIWNMLVCCHGNDCIDIVTSIWLDVMVRD